MKETGPNHHHNVFDRLLLVLVMTQGSAMMSLKKQEEEMNNTDGDFADSCFGYYRPSEFYSCLLGLGDLK